MKTLNFIILLFGICLLSLSFFALTVGVEFYKYIFYMLFGIYFIRTYFNNLSLLRNVDKKKKDLENLKNKHKNLLKELKDNNAKLKHYVSKYKNK